ncbi:MAG: transcriptional regulator, AraC family [Anaerocolumna sp.]|nr:transcriptional regulator, AraC family [Anaerocolumna sp.]
MDRLIFSEKMDGLVIDEVIRDQEGNMPMRHFHDTYEMYFLLEGERYYFIDQETYHVKKGDIVLVNRQQIHKTSQASSSYHDRILIQLDGRILESYIKFTEIFTLDELFSECYGVVQLTDSVWIKVREMLFEIRDEIKVKAEKWKILVCLKMIELFLLIYRYRKTMVLNGSPKTVQTSKHQKVHEVAEYLQYHCESAESIDNVAKRFYISKSYLSRIFREVTGFSVNEYRNIARIKKAQRLLLSSTYSVTEISELLGFESVTYFERVFKKHSDMTPLTYKKSMRKT